MRRACRRRFLSASTTDDPTERLRATCASRLRAEPALERGRLAGLPKEPDAVLLDLAVERGLAELEALRGLRDVPSAETERARDLALLHLGERHDDVRRGALLARVA